MLRFYYYSIVSFLFCFLCLNKVFSQTGLPDTTFQMIGTFVGNIYATEFQSDEKLLVGGEFNHYRAKPQGGIIRFHKDGSIDHSFATGSGFDRTVYSIETQSDNKIIVGGNFTEYNKSSAHGIIRLNPDGSVDPTFNTGNGIINGLVYKILIQEDQKIILAGSFNTFNDLPYKNIVRLNNDGSVDNTFVPLSEINSWIRAAVLLSDGRIAIGGDYTSLNGKSINRFACLHPDGTLDESFDTGTGVDAQIDAMALEHDGHILIGGFFNQYNGISQLSLARINADGTLNTAFQPSIPFPNSVEALAIQEDNKIIIGGQFEVVNGETRYSTARLNPDGSLDNSFKPLFRYTDFIYSIAIDNDGNIFMGGNFAFVNEAPFNNLVGLTPEGNSLPMFKSQALPDKIQLSYVQPDGKIIYCTPVSFPNSVATSYIYRLNEDGTADTTFKPGLINGLIASGGGVRAILVLPNRKIVLGGFFTSYNGTAAQNLVRLHPDGTVDLSFDVASGANNEILCMALQKDNKIVMGGFFTSYKGSSANRIARINEDGSLDNSFAIGSGMNLPAQTIVVLSSGKIIAGGSFSSYNGTACKYIVGINENGSVDNNFQTGTGLNSAAQKIILLPGGTIMVAGNFSKYNGTDCNNIVVLTTNGTVSNSFHSGIAPIETVNNIVLQKDGKVVYTKGFPSLGRLNPDGSIDNTFASYDVPGITSLSIQGDNKIIISGLFLGVSGIATSYIARLNAYPSGYNLIRGRVYSELHSNCISEADETGIANILMKAEPGPFYAITDTAGYYAIAVDSGSINYKVSQVLNPFQNYMIQKCPVQSYQVNLKGYGKDTCCFDFSNEIKNCSYLTIDVTSERRRRCFRNVTYLDYSNLGNEDAHDVKIKLVYPEYVKPLSAIPAWTSQTDSLYIYELPVVKAGQYGRIYLIDSVLCRENIGGLTQCLKATIEPGANCEATSPDWDRSMIAVMGICKGENAVFTLKNVGTGAMEDSLQYRVFVNDTLIYYHNFKLTSGEESEVKVKAEGNTVRLEADQAPYYPGLSRPRSIIEACGGSLSTAPRGHVTTVAQDDEAPDVAISCIPITGSYDPNDKNAVPSGITTHNYLKGTERIEYTIRFQNTGTDTAFTVVIKDTLDAFLDFSTFARGESSHPCDLKVTGKGQPILTFSFENILLPDSTTDKVKSNGFVKYSISPLNNLGNGTSLTNTAAIYFDFNSPVITNTVVHTIYNEDIENLSKGNLVNNNGVTSIDKQKGLAKIQLFPNPSAHEVYITISSSNILTSSVRILTVTGKKVLEENLKIGINSINVQSLPEGIYFYEIMSEDVLIGNGKFIKQ